MGINKGDTVMVLAHRNAFGEDISTWRPFPYKIGETFVVGRVEFEDCTYPCASIFPLGEESEFWREDDLELIEAAPVSVLTRIDRIRHYRSTRGVGLLEAKRMVEREDRLAEIDAAHSINDLKAILRQMVQPCP